MFGNPVSFVDPDGEFGIGIIGAMLAQTAVGYLANGVENWAERGMSFGDAFSFNNVRFVIGGSFGGNQFTALGETGGAATFDLGNAITFGDFLSGSNVNWLAGVPLGNYGNNLINHNDGVGQLIDNYLALLMEGLRLPPGMYGFIRTSRWRSCLMKLLTVLRFGIS